MVRGDTKMKNVGYSYIIHISLLYHDSYIILGKNLFDFFHLFFQPFNVPFGIYFFGYIRNSMPNDILDGVLSKMRNKMLALMAYILAGHFYSSQLLP